MSCFPHFSTLQGQMWWKRDLFFLENASFSVVSLCYAEWSYALELKWCDSLVTEQCVCLLFFFTHFSLPVPSIRLESCPFLVHVGLLVELFQFTEMLEFIFFCQVSFVLVWQTESPQHKSNGYQSLQACRMQPKHCNFLTEGPGSQIQKGLKFVKISKFNPTV